MLRKGYFAFPKKTIEARLQSWYHVHTGLSKELAGIDPADIPAVQAAARMLLRRHDREMDEKYGK